MWKPDRLLDLFLQTPCPLCRRATPSILCLYCSRALLSCQEKHFHQSHHAFPLFSWGIYDDALKRAIAACKYDNKPTIAEFLGKEMGKAWKSDRAAQQLPKLIAVPIPMHAEKLKKRGFNQAEVLARGFCRITGMACKPHILQRSKNTKPQIETRSKQDRLDNLHQAFQATPHAAAQPILLIDDIYTSGATIQEALRACASVGITVAATLVLARTPVNHR